MISQIDITGKNKYEIDENTQKYTRKHIGKLDKSLPRHAKKTVSAKVVIEQINGANDNKYEVEAILTIPDKTLVAKDQSSNVLAAVDIVEAKLESQIRRYKTEKNPRIGKSSIMAKFKRSFKRG